MKSEFLQPPTNAKRPHNQLKTRVACYYKTQAMESLHRSLLHRAKESQHRSFSLLLSPYPFVGYPKIKIICLEWEFLQLRNEERLHNPPKATVSEDCWHVGHFLYLTSFRFPGIIFWKLFNFLFIHIIFYYHFYHFFFLFNVEMGKWVMGRLWADTVSRLGQACHVEPVA